MVLIVATCPDEESVMTRAVRQFGVESFRVVRSADDAVRELEGGRLPRLVLMDLDLPWRRAMELTARLRANPETAAVPIVGLTDSCDPCLALEAYLGGASAVVLKPVDFRDFHEMVASVLQFWLRVAVPAYSALDQVGGTIAASWDKSTRANV